MTGSNEHSEDMDYHVLAGKLASGWSIGSKESGFWIKEHPVSGAAFDFVKAEEFPRRYKTSKDWGIDIHEYGIKFTNVKNGEYAICSFAIPKNNKIMVVNGYGRRLSTNVESVDVIYTCTFSSSGSDSDFYDLKILWLDKNTSNGTLVFSIFSVGWPF